MQTNRLYEQVRMDLWNIRKLGVRRVEQALLSLIPAHLHQHIVPMMRECLQASKRNPELLQYLQLIDLLLNHPLYHPILHSCLIEFYPLIVSSLRKAGHREEVEEAKVIRKYWVRRIHPALYADLREATLRKAEVDVDFFDSQLDSDALQHVHHYYKKVLKMPPQQLFYYLPQAAHSGCLLAHNHQDTRRQRPKQAKASQLTSTDWQRRPSQLKGFSESQNDIVKTNYQSQKKSLLPQYAIGKRIRYSSEETNAGDSCEQYDILRKILPKAINTSILSYHPPNPPNLRQTKPEAIRVEQKPQGSLYPEAALEAKKLLANIALLSRFDCAECGIRFEIKEQLDEHKINHIKEKLAMHQKDEIKRKMPAKFEKHEHFLSSAQWSLKRDKEDQTQAELITISRGLDKQRLEQTCYFCGHILEQRFVEDDWKLENAIRVCLKATALSGECFMHASCAKTLLEEENNLTDWQVRLE